MTPDTLAKSANEHGHQRALFAWINKAAEYGFAAAWDDRSYTDKAHAESMRGPYVGDIHPANLHLAFAIPNGGERNKAVAAKLKAEGVKPGVPDICVPVAVGSWHGLYVEMKKIGGKASDEQKEWNRALTLNGYRVYLCEGWRMAAEAIQLYIVGRVTYEQQ